MSTAASSKTKKVFDGHYEIGSVVGRGAKSVVYEARLISNPKERVALKVLLAGESQNATTERLRREALALVSCRHKYVVRLDDFHSAGPLSYLALEFAELGDLRRYSSQNVLSLETIERFLKQSLEALAYVHRAGIIHRDIKPENILVASDKEIRITDFGVALLPGEEASLADLQSGIGTMNYMAPEIIEGKQLDARADLYALGVIFYELLAGKNPFEDAPLAKQLDLRREESFTELGSSSLAVPGYMEAILLKVMSYSPEDRFSTADEMLQALIEGHSDAFEKDVSEIKGVKEKGLKRNRLRTLKVRRPKTVPLTKRYKYKDAEREAEKLFKELFGDDADWLNETPSDKDKNAVIPVADSIASLASKEAPAETAPTVSPPLDPIDYSGTKIRASDAVIEPTEAISHADSTLQIDPDIDMPTAVMVPESTVQIPVQKSITVAPRRAESTQRDPAYDSFQPEPKKLRRFFLPAMALAFILFAGPTLVRNTGILFSSLSELHLSSILPFGLFSTDSSDPILPAQNSTARDEAFPLLSAGIYQGSIRGLLGNGELPLSLISNPQLKQLGLIIHLEGFKPVWVSTENLTENEPVRFSSSGLVLELTAQSVDGEITGFYKNLVSGRQGKWSVR